MKAILIDSDVLIEVSRNRDEDLVQRWLKLVDGGTPLKCSAVSVAEIWAGARPSEFAATEDLFRLVECVNVDDRIARRAGDILRSFAKSHGVDFGDALIAATALVHDLPLWTRNRKHYPSRDLRLAKL